MTEIFITSFINEINDILYDIADILGLNNYFTKFLRSV